MFGNGSLLSFFVAALDLLVFFSEKSFIDDDLGCYGGAAALFYCVSLADAPLSFCECLFYAAGAAGRAGGDLVHPFEQ